MVFVQDIVIAPEFLSAEPLGSNVIAVTTKGGVDLSTVKVTLNNHVSQSVCFFILALTVFPIQGCPSYWKYDICSSRYPCSIHYLLKTRVKPYTWSTRDHCWRWKIFQLYSRQRPIWQASPPRPPDSDIAHNMYLVLTSASSHLLILLFMVLTSLLMLIILNILVLLSLVGVVTLLLLTIRLAISPMLGPIGTLKTEILIPQMSG